jgi:hypothetical protein
MAKPSNQQVPFRLLQMPCCNILICWVNPRRPNYCPECGKFIFKSYSTSVWNNNYSKSWLRVENHDKAFIQCPPLVDEELKKIIVDFHSNEEGE